MLPTLVAAGFCSLLALGLAVESRSRLLRGAMATVSAAALLAMMIAYLDLASKALPTVSAAHAKQAPASKTLCVRQGIVPACNCVGAR